MERERAGMWWWLRRPWVPVNDSYAKAAGKRQGLSTASLVQGLSFAPDFYMSTTPAMLSTVGSHAESACMGDGVHAKLHAWHGAASL